MKAVRPHGYSTGEEGLSQDGDTAEKGVLKPMVDEGDEGMGEESEAEVRAPNVGAGGSHPQADLGAEGPEVAEEEGEVVKVRRAPKGPTKKEREEHEATHIPYREWCPHCVRGRGVNRPHRSEQGGGEESRERRVPRVSMDYFFMGQGGERASEYPMIVMVDEETDYRYMRAVGKKGLGEGKEMEWLIKDMDEELRSWGHAGGDKGEVILKSDGEPSIKALRDALGRYHGGKVIPEQPPPGESQANGRVEEAGKTLRGYVKVFKDVLEKKTGEKIPTDAAILQWLVRWAAMLHSRFRLGTDGKTAYERQKGRKCRAEVVPFGEVVHYRKLEDDGRKKKLDSPWEEGVWLGHARGSNETLVGTREGVVRAWAIKRMPEEERWSAEAIKGMKGTPARPNPQMPGNDVPVQIHVPIDLGEAMPEGPPPARNEEAGRRTYLKAKDFEKHGFTEGCEGCRRLKAGGMSARPHTEECRQRIEAKLKEEENPRWTRAKNRLDEKMWAEVQRQENNAASSGGAGDEESEKKRKRSEEPEAEVERKDSTEGRQEEQAEVDAEETQDSHERKREAPETDGSDKEEIEAKRNKTSDLQGQKREVEELTPKDEEERPCTRRKVENDPGDTEVVQALRRVDVAEVYSPPRVTIQAKRYGLRAGEAMDLSTGWDFRRREERRRAEQYLDENKPKLLIGSPMCTMFSPLQRLTPWTQRKEDLWTEHRRRLKFVVSLYRKQIEEGRYFLHEHPLRASSWGMKEVQDVCGVGGVRIVVGDQCMYGLTTEGSKKGEVAPAMKSTKFMTNSYHIAQELRRRCNGSHKHQALTDGRAARAARYPPELCRAICRGMLKEIAAEEAGLRAVAEVRACSAEQKAPSPSDFHEEEEQISLAQIAERQGEGAWDDVTGMPLDEEEVRRARREEIEYVRSKKVWTKIPRADAVRRGMKIIKTRWIDINKGDDENPIYRSRFVAKEYNDGEVQGLFAGTPPLEALRYIIHRAATKDGGQKVVMINDVARAFFEAETKRQVCVEIPEEDKTEMDKKRDMVGLLQMSLYGTRDAARNWQEEVARMMRSWGFRQGVYNPCLYFHRVWRITTLVHGDDFVSTGEEESVRKFRGVLEERFKIKTQIVGHGGGEDVQSEARVLNRIVRATDDGWEYEPDQRHIELLIEGLGLGQAKGVSSPGEEERKWEEDENKEELQADEARRFRGHAARLNYLAADRPDIAYSVKEVCRAMAKPTRGAWKKLKRIARYLIEAKRIVMEYPWQGVEDDVEVYTDSDWAGCRQTGKSTSGGAIMIGGHFIKGWATTQASVTLSSAEAELVAMTKATAEVIGVLNMMRDLGDDKKAVVYADSAAALAIADRKGSGKLRHINIRMLWIQEKERRGEVELRKIKGALNPADLMTKYLTGTRISDLMSRLGQRSREGKARTALEVQGSGKRQ